MADPRPEQAVRHTDHTPIHFCRVLSATHLSLIALYVLVDHLSAAGLSLHYCPCRVVLIGAFVGRPPPPKGLGLGVLLKAAKFIGAGKRRLASHWQWSACVPCQYLQKWSLVHNLCLQKSRAWATIRWTHLACKPLRAGKMTGE